VVDEAGRLVGIVTVADVFRFLCTASGVQRGGPQIALRLEAKLPLSGRDDGALRLAAAWLPDLGADGLDPSPWSFTARLDLGLADRGNAMLGLELDLGGDPSCSLRVSW